VRFSYVAVLGFILLGTLWLEVFLRTRVLRRWRRLLLAVVPVACVFAIWDLYAIAAGHWDFDVTRITGIYLLGDLPLDEVLFFLIVPLAAILTLEAVRSVKGWTAGDETGSEAGNHARQDRGTP
jgi:lycopene cyclase domain-containing protein